MDEARLDKLKRRAPQIATSAHLEKILASFPEEDRAEIREQIQPLLNLKDSATLQ